MDPTRTTWVMILDISSTWIQSMSPARKVWHFFHTSKGLVFMSPYTGIAEIGGPEYIQSGTGCFLDFWAYLSPNMSLRPMLRHIQLDMVSPLEMLDSNVLQESHWSKVQIGIGRHRDRFTILFSLIYFGGRGNIALFLPTLSPSYQLFGWSCSG